MAVMADTHPMRYWETTEDMLAMLARMRVHARVTEPQLHRWQRAGLIPRPVQRGAGAGNGSVAYYPPGTAAVVALVWEILLKDRSIERAREALWGAGYPVYRVG